MKRAWETDELVEYWTLMPPEVEFLANKIGATKLGCAVLLKFFQMETRFPQQAAEVPQTVIDYLAKQVKVAPEQFQKYAWRGRTIEYHRAQIRQLHGFREATVEDANALSQWLQEHILVKERDYEHLKVAAYQKCRELKIEPPTPERVDRIVRSAARAYEEKFCAEILSQLTPENQTLLDSLLQTSLEEPEHQSNPGDEKAMLQRSVWQRLKADSGRASIETMFEEIAKLEQLRNLNLPADLFADVPRKILLGLRRRAAVEEPYELRRHPSPLRYTLLAAFCYLLMQGISDTLVDVLLEIVHRIGVRAERKVEKEILEDFKKVTGKTNLLFRLAEATLERPDGIVKEVVYPVVPEPTLRDLVKEWKANGPAYRRKVSVLMRNSYRSHYRRIIPKLLETLEFRLSMLKAEMSRHWQMTSLLDILKETDFRVGFTETFKSPTAWESLERTELQPRLLLSFYGLGTNTGLKRMSAGEHGFTYKDLLYVRRRFINKDHLRNAIRQVVNAIFRVRQPNIWGEGTTACASDSKKFGAYDQNLMTEWHARYGGRGVMIYWHVERKSTCIYSQLKTCSSSEAAAMIEGVLRHCTEMSVNKQYVDSHGQSEVAFAFCRLLGFELLPRLKAIHRQKLYRVENGKDNEYRNLQPILKRAIDWKLIRQQYDLMVKYATALRLGTAETEAILRRFTRQNLQHPTYKALSELGKAIKTIFLCRYLHDIELRREIHEGLNVIEHWNSVNGFIMYGKGGEFASNRREDQEITMLSLHLLQISLVYINTLMIQQILSEPEWQERLQPEDLRALTPLVYSHVTPYGTFKLDMNKRLTIEKVVTA